MTDKTKKTKRYLVSVNGRTVYKPKGMIDKAGGGKGKVRVNLVVSGTEDPEVIGGVVLPEAKAVGTNLKAQKLIEYAARHRPGYEGLNIGAIAAPLLPAFLIAGSAYGAAAAAHPIVGTIGNVTMGGLGAYNLASPTGIMQTYDDFANGRYANGTISAIGDLVDLTNVTGGMKAIYGAVRSPRAAFSFKPVDLLPSVKVSTKPTEPTPKPEGTVEKPSTFKKVADKGKELVNKAKEAAQDVFTVAKPVTQIGTLVHGYNNFMYPSLHSPIPETAVKADKVDETPEETPKSKPKETVATEPEVPVTPKSIPLNSKPVSSITEFYTPMQVTRWNPATRRFESIGFTIKPGIADPIFDSLYQ